MAVNTFKSFLEENHIDDIQILISNETTHTAQQAADVHGVPVSNIVKSLLLKGEKQYYLVLVPGDKRLDIDEWKVKLNEVDLKMADAVAVKNVTGYSIGGVPPFGHSEKITTYIADGFDKEITLVAAAGSANSVFKISFSRLEEIVK